MDREITLKEMVDDLKQVDDLSWGMYAFSRDPLKNKVDSAQKIEFIRKAIACGKEKAEWAKKTYQTSDPYEMAEKLGLKVISSEKGQMADRVLFALFTPPDLIEIMEEPIKKAVASLETTEIISEEIIRKLILGHEIFHFLEEEDKNIYTRNQKIELWNFLGFRNQSTIRALSEIAGMYFSADLTPFCCSLFALDVILYYNYNAWEAKCIYDEIMKEVHSSGKIQ